MMQMQRFFLTFLSVRRRGQVALASAVFLFFISLAILSGLVSVASREVRNARVNLDAKRSYFVAEAGTEDVIYRIRRGKPVSGVETYTLGGAQATVTITDVTDGKDIVTTGIAAGAVRRISTSVREGTSGVGFLYGIQVSDGGLSMSNNARVNGSVYSNGNIVGSSGTVITGDAVVAGGIASSPTVEWPTHNADEAFATAATNRDVAQSFTATASGATARIAVYLGKTGAPSADLTLRLTADNGGKPATSDLASATIARATVGATPSWINIAFSSAPNLTSGTKYWIVLDYGTNNATNYWNWRKDATDAYAGNAGYTTSNWSSGSATWAAVGGDLAFRVWIGGTSTKIESMTIGNSSTGTGRANLFVSSTVHGSSCPNAYCIIDNPAREELPISDGLIQDWRDTAETKGGTCVPPQCDASGNLILTNGASASIGPIKIPGNLTVDNNAILTVTGVIWVVGEVQLSNNCIVRLSSGYGTLSGMIVSDGEIDISNNCVFQGSGQAGSHIMLLSAKNAPTDEVIDVSNGSVGVIYYAAHGLIHLSNNAAAKEATGYGITMDNNAVITYETGLGSTLFSTGPSGGWSIQSWQEIE